MSKKLFVLPGVIKSIVQNNAKTITTTIRREKNLNDYKLEKALRENEKKLERIYQSPLYEKHVVPEHLLQYEGVRLSVCTDTAVNTKTNRFILWSHKYGLELMDSKPRNYTIHKREQI